MNNGDLTMLGWREELDIVKECMEHEIPYPRDGHDFEMRINPGVYQLDECLEMEKLPKPKTLNRYSDHVYSLRDDRAKRLHEEIAKFWKLQPHFEAKGLLHKRGLLLYGPPGSGKTTLINQEISKAVNEERIVFFAKNPFIMSRSLQNLRQMEPHRQVIAVMEDIDQVTEGYGGYELLEMLCGKNSINNVLFIGTTNYPRKLPSNLLRPGRFDRKIKIAAPRFKLRCEYLENKVGRSLRGHSIEEIATKTKGLGFGHLREMIVMMDGYGASLTEALRSVKELHEGNMSF